MGPLIDVHAVNLYKNALEKVKAEGDFINGKTQGSYKKYYTNDKLEYESFYTNGKITKTINYYFTGEKSSELIYNTNEDLESYSYFNVKGEKYFEEKYKGGELKSGLQFLASNQKPIEFYQVNGTFHVHINEEEAEKVLEILEQIEPNALGKYPSVGIATFNITQRNFIKRKIAYKQSLEGNNPFREKMIHLEAAGFFIKNLENIQGDERDIIIISTTYGPKKDGKFTQSFGPINHTKGYKLLNVIITRAKEKIYVCNSVPVAMYSNYKAALEQEGSNNRRAVFYAYLSYCKAVSEENETLRKEILNDFAF